jgi:ATP-binding cassette, subfamily A (ABC1), member 3
VVVSKEFSLLTGSKLRMYQIEAMIRKKYLNAIRSYVISLIQLFIPILFLVMTILTVRLFIATPPLSKLEIELESYNELVTILETRNFPAGDPLARISSAYESIFAAQRPELRTLDVTNERIDRHFLNLVSNRLKYR